MRTTTAVHDEASSAVQRQREQRQESELTLSIAMEAQVLSYGALYILPAASTAAWWVVLALLPPAGLMRLLGWAIQRTAPESAERSWPYRAAALGLSLLFLTNMAVCLLTLTELTHVFFFSQAPRLLIALSAALALGLGMPASPAAAPNLARFLCWFLLAAFIFCMITVIPSSEPGYLFPLAGYGALPTLRVSLTGWGSVWMAGALSVLRPNQKASSPVRAALPGMTAILLTALLFFCCALVLPGTRLNYDMGYALRLQLLMEMSPNVLSWSLMLMAEMLLFLTGFAVCADLMRKCLQTALCKSRVPLLPFALLCVPLAVIGMGQAGDALARLLPWRYPAAFALLLLCLITNLIVKKKGKTP